MEKILPYTCRCGGILKKSQCNVEFFGIDFGVRECEICTSCNSEYLDDMTLTEVEQEVKKRKLFALEKNVQITKSGNSLVIRIPPEIAQFAHLSYKTNAKIYPVDEKRIAIELAT